METRAMPNPNDDMGRLWFELYVAVGVPIAYWHVKRQGMKDSLKQPADGAGTRYIVITTLAMMWPILLFAYLVEPKKKKADK